MIEPPNIPFNRANTVVAKLVYFMIVMMCQTVRRNKYHSVIFNKLKISYH